MMAPEDEIRLSAMFKGNIPAKVERKLKEAKMFLHAFRPGALSDEAIVLVALLSGCKPDPRNHAVSKDGFINWRNIEDGTPVTVQDADDPDSAYAGHFHGLVDGGTVAVCPVGQEVTREVPMARVFLRDDSAEHSKRLKALKEGDAVYVKHRGQPLKAMFQKVADDGRLMVVVDGDTHANRVVAPELVELSA